MFQCQVCVCSGARRLEAARHDGRRFFENNTGGVGHLRSAGLLQRLKSRTKALAPNRPQRHLKKKKKKNTTLTGQKPAVKGLNSRRVSALWPETINTFDSSASRCLRLTEVRGQRRTEEEQKKNRRRTQHERNEVVRNEPRSAVSKGRGKVITLARSSLTTRLVLVIIGGRRAFDDRPEKITPALQSVTDR